MDAVCRPAPDNAAADIHKFIGNIIDEICRMHGVGEPTKVDGCNAAQTNPVNAATTEHDLCDGVQVTDLLAFISTKKDLPVSVCE